MEKKRRDKKTTVPLGQLITGTLEDRIAVLEEQITEMGLVREEYRLMPVMGRGSIIKYIFNGVEVVFCRFLLKEDLLVYYQKPMDLLQLTFVQEGEMILSMKDGGADIICENQESFFVPMGEASGERRISGGKIFKEVVIGLSTDFLKNHGLGDVPLFKKTKGDNTVSPLTVDMLALLGAMESSGHHGIAKQLFLQAKILEILVMQITNHKKPLRLDTPKANTEMVKRLYEARRLIMDNLDENFSIKVLSKKVLLNEYLLKKEFKRIFGDSVNAFGRNEKMKHAKNLLQATQLPIYQIAEEVGYKNATHFSVAFKRFTGDIPKKYRSRL
ncbi:MAG: AraC family transcriptional regulator [Sediminicola sp.]